MPNPTAVYPISQSSSTLMWARPSQIQQAVQNQQPINPGGQINMPVSSAAAAPVHTTFQLPTLYQGWFNAFKNWAQGSDFQNQWWQNWQTWFQGWDGAQASNNGGGAQIPTPSIPVTPVSIATSTETGDGGGTESSGSTGLGQYIGTPTYFSTPAGQAGIRGLGCGCGCSATPSCGCSGGMGTLGDGTGLLGSGLFNGSGVAGSGLFEGGFDLSTWGPAEWAVIALGGYVVFSTIWTTRQGISYGASIPKRVGKAARGVKSSFL